MKQYAPTIFISALLLGVGIGCTNSNPTPPKVSTPAPEEQEQKDDRDNPMVREAMSDTEKVLNDLLAGKYDEDPNWAILAKKLKGFQSWSITTRNIDPDHPQAVNFGGTLKGQQVEATFTASMVKQQKVDDRLLLRPKRQIAACVPGQQTMDDVSPNRAGMPASQPREGFSMKHTGVKAGSSIHCLK